MKIIISAMFGLLASQAANSFEHVVTVKGEIGHLTGGQIKWKKLNHTNFAARITLDTVGNFLYVATGNEILVYNLKTSQYVTTLPDANWISVPLLNQATLIWSSKYSPHAGVVNNSTLELALEPIEQRWEEPSIAFDNHALRDRFDPRKIIVNYSSQENQSRFLSDVLTRCINLKSKTFYGRFWLEEQTDFLFTNSPSKSRARNGMYFGPRISVGGCWSDGNFWSFEGEKLSKEPVNISINGSNDRSIATEKKWEDLPKTIALGSSARFLAEIKDKSWPSKFDVVIYDFQNGERYTIQSPKGYEGANFLMPIGMSKDRMATFFGSQRISRSGVHRSSEVIKLFYAKGRWKLARVDMTLWVKSYFEWRSSQETKVRDFGGGKLIETFPKKLPVNPEFLEIVGAY